MDFKEELEKRISDTEKIVYAYLPKEEGYQKTVIQAMNYSISAGGKRLRPLLMDETYLLFGGTVREEIEPFMAAIEMIHTYSLIHDDLPAMDNDEYRRGKKTTHTVYGEAMGILAGDGLLNYAFEIACKAFDTGNHTDRIIKAMKLLASRPGIDGMLGGQAADVESEGQKVSMEKLLFIHQKKTSALIEAAMMIGAVLAGADEAAVKQIEEAARHLGLAFQIQDDILDVTGTAAQLGKPVHSDERNEKNTYVTLAGLKKAREDVGQYSARALSLLKETGRENTFLWNLVTWLTERKN